MEERKCTKEELGVILQAQKELYVKPDDQILLVIDEEYKDAPIKDAFLGFNYELVRIPRVERPGQDYDLNERLLEGKTLGWLISAVSISHASSTGKMLDRGMYLISNPGITPDWKEALDARNSEPCRKQAEAILKVIGGDVGGIFYITADDGTNLRLKVPKGNWISEYGTREGIGTNGPYGELFTAPYWAEGVYILNSGDFLTNPINRVKEKVSLHIFDNRLTGITGDKYTIGILDKMLNDAITTAEQEPMVRNLGEFAFQLNPAKAEKICRSVIAEKIAGGVHIAIGSNKVCVKEDCPELNKFKYGRYSAGIHIDCIKFGATVTFEGETMVEPIAILKNGKFMI